MSKESLNVENKTIRHFVIQLTIETMKDNPRFDNVTPADRRHTINRVMHILSKSEADWWMDATEGEKRFFLYVVTEMVLNEIELRQDVEVFTKKDIERLNEDLELSS